MRSMSDSDPTRIPTTGPSANSCPLLDPGCDVRTVSSALELDSFDPGVRVLPGLRDRSADACDAQDAASVRHQVAVPQGRSGVEDDRPGGLGLLELFALRAA